MWAVALFFRPFCYARYYPKRHRRGGAIVARGPLAHPGRCESAASAALGGLAKARGLVKPLLRWDSRQPRRTLSAARPFSFREALCMEYLVRLAFIIGAAALFAEPLAAQAATPAPTASPGTQGMTISWPPRIDISSRSAAVFNGYNRGVGSIMVMIKCDGTKSSFIPPTPDIDDALRVALTKFVADTQVTVSQPCSDQVFLVGFHVPSGDMTEVPVPPPSH